jgi:protein-L-isoaspartate(D-aspartate) O-methyltransferase
MMDTENSYLLLGKRRQMVKLLIEKGIANKDILHAFEKVERERFIGGPIFNIGLPALADMIYSDSIIPIGEKRFLPPPFYTAELLEKCNIKTGDKILEIGTGTGYQAALLATLGAEVYTFESSKLFKDKVKILFQVLGYTNVHLIEETQFNNFVFDKIICNGVLNIDKVELYKRLKTGGVFYVTTLSNKLFEFNLFENK